MVKVIQKTHININMNDRVKVWLTDYGLEILKHELSQEIFDMYIKNSSKYNCFEFTFWKLMNIFGKYIYDGCKLPFRLDMEIIND
jgi:hypothetical protein